MRKHKYRHRVAKMEIKLSGHVIKRFYERFLGFEWSPQRGRDLSVEIGGIIEKLLAISHPYAKAQHNVLIYYADWFNECDNRVGVYMLIDCSRGEMKMRTVLTEKIAKTYFERGAWKKIWFDSGNYEKNKKCSG